MEIEQVIDSSLPLVIESRAHPAPVAPPPMMITSYSSPLCSVFTCSDRGGSLRLTRGVAIAAAFTFLESKKFDLDFFFFDFLRSKTRMEFILK